MAKIKRTPQVLVNEDEYIPWAGKTNGQMIDDIYRHEKKTGKDKEPGSFTNTMELIGKVYLEYWIKDMSTPVACISCKKKTIKLELTLGRCVRCFNKWIKK